MKTPNKIKNTRLVTFKEDYTSKPGKDEGYVIYKKGTTHAIHKSIVKELVRKGAKLESKEPDYEAAVKRAKKQLTDNAKK